MVFVASCQLAPSVADELEELLCEYVRSCWTLTQVKEGEPYTLSGYFDSVEAAAIGWISLRADFPRLPHDYGLTELPDQDWQEAYKQFLEPWTHGGLHWVPEWQRDSYPVPAGEVAVYFDAGMAFGTGSHPTTRLMARRLLEYRLFLLGEPAPALRESAPALAKPRVIDVGCGSGILAVSAALVGFTQVYAFDQDPEAITVTSENQDRNGLAHRPIEVRQAALEDGLTARQGDLLLANIISDVLLIHRKGLLQATAPGGWLALSGILASETAKVRDAFVEAVREVWGGDAVRVDERTDGDWSDVLLVRG